MNFIIGHKEETYKQALDTIKFASKLDTGYVSFNQLMPVPGTEAYEWAIAHGKNMKPYQEYMTKMFSTLIEPVYETNEFTRIQRIKVMKKAFYLFRRTHLQLRLGKFLGSIAYLFARINFLFRIVSAIALHTKLGSLIYIRLSKKSRRLEYFD